MKSLKEELERLYEIAVASRELYLANIILHELNGMKPSDTEADTFEKVD